MLWLEECPWIKPYSPIRHIFIAVVTHPGSAQNRDSTLCARIKMAGNAIKLPSPCVPYLADILMLCQLSFSALHKFLKIVVSTINLWTAQEKNLKEF